MLEFYLWGVAASAISLINVCVIAYFEPELILANNRPKPKTTLFCFIFCVLALSWISTIVILGALALTCVDDMCR